MSGDETEQMVTAVTPASTVAEMMSFLFYSFQSEEYKLVETILVERENGLRRELERKVQDLEVLHRERDSAERRLAEQIEKGLKDEMEQMRADYEMKLKQERESRKYKVALANLDRLKAEEELMKCKKNFEVKIGVLEGQNRDMATEIEFLSETLLKRTAKLEAQLAEMNSVDQSVPGKNVAAKVMRKPISESPLMADGEPVSGKNVAAKVMGKSISESPLMADGGLAYRVDAGVISNKAPSISKSPRAESESQKEVGNLETLKEKENAGICTTKSQTSLGAESSESSPQVEGRGLDQDKQAISSQLAGTYSNELACDNGPLTGNQLTGETLSSSKLLYQSREIIDHTQSDDEVAIGPTRKRSRGEHSPAGKLRRALAVDLSSKPNSISPDVSEATLPPAYNLGGIEQREQKDEGEGDSQLPLAKPVSDAVDGGNDRSGRHREDSYVFPSLSKEVAMGPIKKRIRLEHFSVGELRRAPPVDFSRKPDSLSPNVSEAKSTPGFSSGGIKQGERKDKSEGDSQLPLTKSVSGAVDGRNDRSASHLEDSYVFSSFSKEVEGLQRSKESTWRYSSDMLFAFMSDPDLCVNAICALYRQQVSAGKSTASVPQLRDGGLSAADIMRLNDVASYLINKDPENKLSRSVSEVRQDRPSVLDDSQKLATRYVEEIFKIYQKKMDPFFCPKS